MAPADDPEILPAGTEPAKRQQDEEKSREAGREARKHWFEGTVAVFTALMFGAMIWQTWLTRQSVRVAEREQRAWVGIGEVRLDPPVLTPGVMLGFVVTFTNTGRSPATDVWQLTWYGSIPPGEAIAGDERLEANGPLHRQAVFHPGAMNSIVFRKSEPLTQDDIDRFTGKNGVFHVLGKLTYRDVFGVSHSTRFCYRLEGHPLALSGCEAYNEAD